MNPEAVNKCGNDLPWQIRPFASSCYFVSSAVATHTASKESCEKYNATLVSISNYEEQVYIQNSIKSGKSYWLGGRRNLDRGWNWLDSSPFAFSNWASMVVTGDINELTNDLNFCSVIASESNNQWRAVKCSSEVDNDGIRFNFICKKNQNTGSFGTTPQPVTTPVDQNYYFYCSDGSWSIFKQNCYQYVNKKTDHTTFFNARQECKKIDSDLVDVFDEAENNFLVTLTQKQQTRDLLVACPTGWTMSLNADNCYKVIDLETTDWAKAQKFCQTKYDAYLVSIKTEVEQNFIYSSFSQQFSK